MKENKTLRTAIFAGCAVLLAGALVALTIFVFIPAGRYAQANSLAATDPARAFAAFDRMGDYRNAHERMQEIREQVFASRSTEYVEFGGREWLVLEQRDGNALLLLREVLPARAYHEALVDVTWENSNIRTYLNGAFFNRFSEEERARIVETEIVNSDHAEFGTSGGNNTTDHVFLLSMAEARLYFADPGTRVARHEGSSVHAAWWLRCPGMEPFLAAFVQASGELAFTGSGVNQAERTVRPAMWVTLAR